MTFEEFKILHRNFSKPSLQRDVYDADAHETYIEAFQENAEFSNWVLIQEMEKDGFDYSSYCCVTMAHHIYDSIDDDGEIKYDDHDIIINKWKDGTFGIPIHDGGSSIVKINFCPWCGENLKNDE